MKKIFSIFLLIVICFTFAGCNENASTSKNEDVKDVLMDVLEKEKPFIAKTSAVSDETSEQLLDKYHFSTIDNAYYSFNPAYYTFVDCDTNGIDEMIVLDVNLSCCLILRYEGQKVYGYNYTHIGDVKKVKTNGSFEPKLKSGERKIARFKFSDTEIEIVEDAYMNENANKYFLNEKANDKQIVKKHFDDWDTTTIATEWTKIE
jgi:hypothetical protein